MVLVGTDGKQRYTGQGGKYGTTASVTRCAVETCASSCHLLRAVGSVAGHEVETVVLQSPKGAVSVDVAWF